MSEKEILDKLEEIEKKVEHIEQMEEAQLKVEEKIEKEEETELEELKEATKKLMFTDITEWQMNIWQNCQYKKEEKEKKDAS